MPINTHRYIFIRNIYYQKGITEIICCADERHTVVRHTTKPPVDDGEDDVYFV